MTAMYPVSIWAPIFELSPYDEVYKRDLEAAVSAWDEELIIWLSPEADEVVQWCTQSGLRECLVPAERFNKINICYVDKERNTYPAVVDRGRFKQKLPADLYQEWMRAKPTCKPTPAERSLVFPVVRNGKLQRYASRSFNVVPGPFVPAYAIDRDQRRLLAGWPARDKHGRPTVSPETDSEHVYGRPEFEVNEAGDLTGMAVAQDTGTRGLPIEFHWPGLLGRLLQFGGGPDVHSDRFRMQNYLKHMTGQHNAVLQEVQTIVSRYTQDTSVTTELADFLPKYRAADSSDSHAALLGTIEDRYGIKSDSIEEIRRLPKFQDFMKQPVPITRVFGWVGYFWWEFYFAIAELRYRGLCKHCERPLEPGSKGIYCQRGECGRSRTAARVRKHREASSR